MKIVLKTLVPYGQTTLIKNKHSGVELTLTWSLSFQFSVFSFQKGHLLLQN